MHEYAAKAKVPAITFHALRKVFTTEFLRAGGSPKQAQYWLGHATHHLVMQVYGQLQEEQDLAAAVLDINNLQGVDHTATGTANHPVKRGSKPAAASSKKPDKPVLER